LNENDVVSDDTTVDGDSEDEKISGSAESHSVFNLAELARFLEDGDDGFAFFTPSLLTTVWVQCELHRVSNVTDTVSGFSPGKRLFVHLLMSQI
jgi:hypothetical protein